ncbi:fungal-specific transcription factor domain-containing protein [Dactylonectria estremocensis]|uniref:Fungal-specific transcription factor domain-containing protein n=1 Tax=Dactylonectria estremocensis TaxID=1079267 RepID=A0A9P9IP94_9HYPO|nr:fungal-specific transcription factor domain-containing protein [Dactylonectria estremocensis]
MKRSQRSRSGCWTCREDGYKCDEQKPFCGRCIRLSKTCQGYGIRLKWQKLRAPDSKATVRHLDSFRIQNTSPLTRISTVKFGDERLVHHWQTVLAGIVSISAGPHNPFLSHLTPLLDNSISLRSVITSMAANHLAIAQPDSNLLAVANQHRLRAINHLRESLYDAPAEISLATVMLLQMSERIFVTDTKVDHLEGARALIRHQGGQTAWSSSTGKFLLGLCWYHDVLSSVSKSQPPVLGLHDILVEGSKDLSKLSAVLRVVGEISQLRSANCRLDDEEALDVFEKLISLEEKGTLDDDSRNVEAHRQAAFIYFYRSTTGLKDIETFLLLHANFCLQHLAKIPSSSALISSHIWPLWTAGCETVDRELREFVLGRLDEMYKARRLTYLQRVKQDVLGVWFMKDLRRNSSGKDDIDCVNAIRSTHHREADII